MAGIIATVTVFAAAQGLNYPLLSFILERQGTTPDLIGLSAAMTPLGFVVSAPFIPALARRIGLAIEVIGTCKATRARSPTGFETSRLAASGLPEAAAASN